MASQSSSVGALGVWIGWSEGRALVSIVTQQQESWYDTGLTMFKIQVDSASESRNRLTVVFC